MNVQNNQMIYIINIIILQFIKIIVQMIHLKMKMNVYGKIVKIILLKLTNYINALANVTAA